MRTRLFPILLISLGVLAAPTAASATVSHLVAPGETLSSVAAADGLSVPALAAANGLAPSAELIAGRELVIPPAGGTAPESGAPSPAAAPASTGGYVVRAGDTLSGIAARLGVSVDSLAAANGIPADGLLLAGRTLAVSGDATAAPTTTAPAAAPVAVSVTPGDVGAAAASAGVPAALAEAIADQESGFNDAEVSDTGAVGVMQIEPGTWDYIHDVLGVPREGTGALANVAGGIALLRSLLAETGGDESEAIAAYYQGLRSLRAHGMYPDTRRYVADVLALEARYGG